MPWSAASDPHADVRSNRPSYGISVLNRLIPCSLTRPSFRPPLQRAALPSRCAL
jgi:hypothetical protein